MRPDDSVDAQQLGLIREHARRALDAAGAVGRFPTRVDEVIEAAKHDVVTMEIDEGFLAKASKKAGKFLKSAISKVLGVLDVSARAIHLDKVVRGGKATFLKLHELGHGVLPWQRDLYAITQDCEKHLDPETSEAFERESNAFASEVLFQIDTFTAEAADCSFGILTPVSLSKKYGASVYASVRRYVTTHDRACAVIVLDPPVACEGDGFRAGLRRVVSSARFTAQFGELSLPDFVTPDDQIGRMVPIGKRRLSGPKQVVLTDRNGTRHECMAEAFTNTYYVFILVCPQAMLTKKIVLMKG